MLRNKKYHPVYTRARVCVYSKQHNPNHGTQYNTDGLSSDILNFYIEFIYT